jgi:hypothetical protein
MDSSTKNIILTRINTIENEDLLHYVQQGFLSWEEILKAGLNAVKRTALEKEINRIENETIESKRREEQAKERVRVRASHLEQIKNRNNDYDEELIKQLLVEDLLSIEDLVQNTHLTALDVDKILNSIEIDTGFDEWAQLPPLENGRTDVYVFGIVGSGKSCLLAGVLHQAEKNGILETDVRYFVGAKYKDELIKRIKLSILPKSTRSDVLNYISVSLFDKEERPHPLSIIEMSGEKFSATYRSGGLNNESSIGARQYLKNSNRKIIMFVIDYRHHITRADLHEMATQSAQLETTLQFLSNDGTLDKTDAVFIVVTKADLFSDQRNIKQEALNFLQEDYLNFLNMSKRMKSRHSFSLIVHAFSLGNFVLPKTYSYEPSYSDNLLSDLISFSFLEKNKPWFKKLFNN